MYGLSFFQLVDERLPPGFIPGDLLYSDTARFIFEGRDPRRRPIWLSVTRAPHPWPTWPEISGLTPQLGQMQASSRCFSGRLGITLEARPPGRPATEWSLPLPPEQAVSAARRLAEIMLLCRPTQPLIGLRPEFIFARGRRGPEGPMIVMPGAAHLIWSGASPWIDNEDHEHAAPPMFQSFYQSPSYLRGTAAAEKDDVFTFCAIVGEWITGTHLLRPDPGEGLMQHLSRIVNGSPDLSGLPDELRDVFAAGLAREPGERCEITDVVRAISKR